MDFCMVKESSLGRTAQDTRGNSEIMRSQGLEDTTGLMAVSMRVKL